MQKCHYILGMESFQASLALLDYVTPNQASEHLRFSSRGPFPQISETARS